MKILVWGLFALLAALWTGFVALVAYVTRWAANGLASGQIKDFASGAAQWPKLEGLPAWIDAQWIDMAQAAVIAALNVFAELSPQLSSLVSWLVPLVWIVWGFGLMALLGVAGGAHWLVTRLKHVPS